MKKLMALCLAMLMALSMVSFSVMAEETEAHAVAVTFEDIANGQPAKFVTGNLVLGENDEIKSSNEAIISNTGVVTRPLFEDATVAISINGGEAVEVTVKSQIVDVKYYNDFTTDDAGTGTSTRTFPSYEGFSVSTAAGTETTIQDGVVKVDIKADYEKGVKDHRTNFYTKIPSFSSSKPVVIQFDVDNIANIKGSSAEIRPTIYAYPTNGGSRVHLGTIQFAKLTATGFGSSGFCSGDSIPVSKSVEIRYIPTTGEIWLNGKKCSKNLLTLKEGDYEYVQLTGLTICCAGSDCFAQFDMDNYVVYQEDSKDEAILKVTPEQRKEYLETFLTPEVFANGQSLASVSSNLTFSTGLDMEALGASLVWTTSDPSVIEANGTIHPKQNTSVNAVVQGTLTFGEETITTKPFNIKLAPAGTVECTAAKFNWDFEDVEVGATSSTTTQNCYSGGKKGIYFSGGSHEFFNDSERGMMLKSTNPNIIQFSAGQRGPGYNKRYVFGFDYKFELNDNATWSTFSTYMRGNGSQQVGLSYTNADLTVGDKTTAYGNATADKVDALFVHKVPCYAEITRPGVWHHIDIDFNSTKNVYTIYVDDNKINEIPGSSANGVGYVAYWMHTQLGNMKTFYMDNMYVNEYTDSNVVKADAALRRAVYDAAARESGQNGLTGPYRTINRKDLSSVITSTTIPTPQTDSNGATLTWKVNGEPHTETTYTAPSSPQTVTFEVTATSGDVSYSQTFTNRFAPVEIADYTLDERNVKTVTIEGDYEGKRLVIAKYSANDGRLLLVKSIDITSSVVEVADENINDVGCIIKYFIYDKGLLVPYAFGR